MLTKMLLHTYLVSRAGLVGVAVAVDQRECGLSHEASVSSRLRDPSYGISSSSRHFIEATGVSFRRRSVDATACLDRLNDLDVLDRRRLHLEWVPVEDDEVGELAGFELTFGLFLKMLIGRHTGSWP